MTSEARIYALPRDPGAYEAAGPVRLIEELHRLAEGETTVVATNEAVAIALHVDVRTVQRWKRALRELVPPAIAVTERNRYSLRMSVQGVTELLSAPRSGVTRATITPDTDHDHPLIADSITPVIPPCDTHVLYARAAAGDRPTTTTTTTTTSHDSHPRSPLATITPPLPRITPMPPTTVSIDDLTVNALIRAAGIQDTPEAVAAMNELPRNVQVEVLEYVRIHARRPNPKFLRLVAENAADQLRAGEYGTFDALASAWAGLELDDDACDELSRREPSTARSAANDAPATEASNASVGETPTVVRGVTPRAGSNTDSWRSLARGVGRVLVVVGGWLERRSK